MTGQTKYYVTSPMYYVNGDPHIGHAYTTILADVMARYHRLQGDNVRFLTGTDEHGLKVQRAAEQRGVEPKQMADEVSTTFRALFDRLGLSYDRFIRTTDEDHVSSASEMARRMVESGDIYKGKYEGWYSASDEAYYDESEIEDGIAVATGSAVEWVAEESYFFRLSEYQDRLLEWYEDNPDCILPESRRNEVISFVESGLQDLSVSRTTFDWGIPWPSDPEHVLYVWLDALNSYFTGSIAHWPADAHIIGKDILRFHAVYWPAFLMSVDLPLPNHIVAHGWWTNEGTKMGKSKGNVIDPVPLLDKYGLDPFRFYLIRESPVGQDGRFSETRLVERYNTELANNIGNLVNRTFSMVRSYLDSEIPKMPFVMLDKDRNLSSRCLIHLREYRDHMDAYRMSKALSTVISLSTVVNRYLQDRKPWKLAGEDEVRLKEVLYWILDAIRLVAVMLAPFLPETSSGILGALDDDLQKLEWGYLNPGVLGEFGVPFPRIEED